MNITVWKTISKGNPTNFIIFVVKIEESGNTKTGECNNNLHSPDFLLLILESKVLNEVWTIS